VHAARVDVVDAGAKGALVEGTDVHLADLRVDGYAFVGLEVRGPESGNVVVDGFDVRNATDPTRGIGVRNRADDVTLRDGRTAGGGRGVVNFDGSRNLTVANVTSAGDRVGVLVATDEELTLRDVTVRNATSDAVCLMETGDGTYERLRVSNAGGAAVNVTDGSARLDNLTTGSGRVSTVVRHAALREPSGTPATPGRVPVAAVEFAPVGTGSSSVELAVPYDPARVNESTVALYRAGSFSWEPVPGATLEPRLDLLRANLTVAGTYAVQAQANESAASSCPTVSGTPATNVDTDPACEDVDGDGDVDLDDAFVLAFDVLSAPPSDPTPFDFDGDGDLDLDDVFALAFSP
jgi:hypothetical protein